MTPEQIERLRECPFCGYHAGLETMEVRKGYEAIVHCNGCLAQILTITYDTEEEAVVAVRRAWNQRHGGELISEVER